MFQIEMGKNAIICIILITKLDQQRRKQAAQTLLLVVPEITIKESK
jgi:hypothetical protein